MHAGDNRTAHLYRLTGPRAGINAVDGDDEAPGYSAAILREKGHSSAMADHAYAGGHQQLDRISRVTLNATALMKCGEWHLLFRPSLKMSRQWQRSWGASLMEAESVSCTTPPYFALPL